MKNLISTGEIKMSSSKELLELGRLLYQKIKEELDLSDEQMREAIDLSKLEIDNVKFNEGKDKDGMIVMEFDARIKGV